MAPYNIPISIHRRQVFDSVFAPVMLKDITPTHVATPTTAFVTPGLGSTLAFTPPRSQKKSRQLITNDNAGEINGSSLEQAKLDRAWRVATTFLSLPDIGFEALAVLNGHGEAVFLKRLGLPSPSQEISDALRYLLEPPSRKIVLHEESKSYNLTKWYRNEMRRHFLTNFRNGFVQVCRQLS
jgi:anaphase-promoting complex subunit 2